MQTGQIIAKLRTEAGISQYQLADALFVSRDLVSKWETGKRLPEYQMILAMAELFSVDPEVMIEKNSILTEELSGVLPDGCPVDADALKKELKEKYL